MTFNALVGPERYQNNVDVRRLFAEVIASLLQTRRFLEDNRGDLASGLTTRAFARAPRTSEEVSPIEATEDMIMFATVH